MSPGNTPLERIKTDMQARVAAQDLADANALSVSARPEYFVNGRRLPSLGYEQLHRLVDEELAIQRGRQAG